MITKRGTKILYKVSSRAFLALAVLIALIPFLDLRMLRMAGDEKVYLTQAIEMAREGRWFVQTLADEPSYFKGPLHYILVRIGMLVFGNHLIAGLWMNAAFALLAGLAMFRLGRKHWNEKSGLLLGLATALNVGVYSHALASQMEVEVCAFYAFAIAALGLSTGRKPSYKTDVWFWIAAGLAGWSKSPVHSVLIGFGGLVFWALTGQLASRARLWQCWAALATGGFGSIAGFLPAYFADKQNFVETFIMREQFQKAHNNRAWHYVMLPLIHFLLPWTFIVAGAIVQVFRKPRKTDRIMLKLALSMALPTLIMWSTWSYKGQNYNLPTISALLLFGWAMFDGELPRWTFRAAGGLGVVAFLFCVGIVAHFWPLPLWWTRGWLVLGFLGTLFFCATFLLSDDARVLGAGCVAFFLAFGAFITPLGQREMIDVRTFLKDHSRATYHYYNLNPSIWSEWSILQLALHHPIYGMHKVSQLAEATQRDHVILVQNTESLDTVLKYWHEHNDSKNLPKPQVTPWTRWLTKAKGPDGQSRLKAAWDARDLRLFERDFFIVWFP